MNKAGVYLRHHIEGGHYYVGQTHDISQRYRRDYNIVAFVPDDNHNSRLTQEQEAIEFCCAFGIPLSNVNLNPQRWAQHEWVPMTEAARQLGVSLASFKKMVKRLAESGFPVHTRRDMFNKTIILVNVDEIREALKNRYQEKE